MFSSNHPIVGFDRPKDLYAVDTVNSTPMDIEVTVRNDGSTASGIITVQLLILHNEYERFELANRTVTMNSLSSSGQGTATFYNVYVNYAGNHTMVVIPSFQGIDDNPSNNNLNSTTPLLISTLPAHHLLVGMQGNTGVRHRYICEHGPILSYRAGQFSSYGNNLQTDLMTPIWDMSDIVANPTRTNGLSFLHRSAQPNDGMKVYAFDQQGNWDELANIAGTVGATLSNWRTISNNHMGHTTPLIPADMSSHFHSNSRFKFTFTSDSSGTDVIISSMILSLFMTNLLVLRNTIWMYQVCSQKEPFPVLGAKYEWN